VGTRCIYNASKQNLTCASIRRGARDLAEGRVVDAVAAFDKAGAITWPHDQVDARTALIATCQRDTAAEPNATRFSPTPTATSTR
jgi:hypothetical protein